MTEGGESAPQAQTDTAATVTNDSAAPVPVEVRAHDNHHADATTHHRKEQDSIGRLTPRPTFMEHLAESRDAMFHLDRRDSSELERYFVRYAFRGSLENNAEQY